jgi:hypothetical protein
MSSGVTLMDPLYIAVLTLGAVDARPHRHFGSIDANDETLRAGIERGWPFPPKPFLSPDLVRGVRDVVDAPSRAR